MQLNGGDYHAYASREYVINNAKQEYVLSLDMTEESDLAPRLAFNFGFFNGENVQTPFDVTLSDVRLVLNNKVGEEVKVENKINLNQVGFLPHSVKKVYFRREVKDYVIVDSNGKEVFQGIASYYGYDQQAGENVWIGDFSSMQQQGRFIVQAGEDSYPFVVSNDVYNQLNRDLLQMFYLQRCGCALTEVEAGAFSHSACHKGTARIVGTYDQYVDVSGGWHDAGDYGRYVVSGAKAVLDLLLAFECSNDTSETQGELPQILQEAKYELDFFFKMQGQDGGVYHKVTCKNFPRLDVMPQDEADNLYVSPVSTTATGDFATVMALASVIYKPYSEQFSDKCLTAAVCAYEFLFASNNLSFKNPSTIVTGEYPDSFDTDERFTSAIALFVATGDKAYEQEAERLNSQTLREGLGWDDMATYGRIMYLLYCPNGRLRDTISDKFFATADVMLSNSKEDGYNVSLTQYPWGSNMVVADNGVVLSFAYRFSNQSKYLTYAQTHLNYLLGANPMGTCYVTGYGTVCPLHPHHRPSIAQHSAMRGMLVGGPSQGLEDDYAKLTLSGSAPSKCYVDNEQSYSTNEICVYWNSPLVLLMALMK